MEEFPVETPMSIPDAKELASEVGKFLRRCSSLEAVALSTWYAGGSSVGEVLSELSELPRLRQLEVSWPFPAREGGRPWGAASGLAGRVTSSARTLSSFSTVSRMYYTKYSA